MQRVLRTLQRLQNQSLHKTYEYRVIRLYPSKRFDTYRCCQGLVGHSLFYVIKMMNYYIKTPYQGDSCLCFSYILE